MVPENFKENGFMIGIGLFIVVFVIAQSLFFLIKAWKQGKKLGISTEKLKNTVMSSAVFTIAPAISILATVIVLAFRPVLPMLTTNPNIAPAFKQVLPALFGALAATYFAKHWRISIFPIMVGVITLIFASTMGVGTLIFVTIIASLLGAFAMYKFGWLDSKEERKAKKAAKAKK